MIFNSIFLQSLVSLEWIWLILIGVTIAVIVKVVKSRMGGKGYYPTDYKKNQQVKEEIDTSRPAKILKERLAKGEISKKEYDELKNEFEAL